MNSLKDRWEIIVGYVALIVSLSAFKDELRALPLNLGFYHTTCADFLFTLILGFLAALHFYLIPFFLSSTRFANLTVLRWLEQFAYFAFVMLATSPVVLALIVGANSAIEYLLSLPPNTQSFAYKAITAGFTSLLSFFSGFLAARYRRQKYSAERQNLENQEIHDLESSQKLFDDSYYSQSILEAFKVLELHLRRLINEKDVPFRSTKFQDLLDVALKLKLIHHSDQKRIDDIRQMRNSAAHLNVAFTKEQAAQAISFVRELIIRTQTS